VYRTRTYEPSEVRRILRRAAELQDAEGKTREGGRPLTLEEIEQLAREAGIDEALVRRATMGDEVPTVGAPAGTKTHPFFGGPGHLSFERKAKGRVGPSNHAQLVKAIRRVLGEAGTAQVLGDSLTWTMTQWGAGGRSGPGRVVSVSIDPEADGVSIRVDESLRNLRAALFGGLLGGGAGGMFGVILPLALALFHSAALGVVGCVLWSLAVFALARALYASRVRARTEELSRLMSGVADTLAREPARSRVAARVEEEGLEDGDEDGGAVVRQGSRRP
jgi:hypothetical protein